MAGIAAGDVMVSVTAYTRLLPAAEHGKQPGCGTVHASMERERQESIWRTRCVGAAGGPGRALRRWQRAASRPERGQPQLQGLVMS